MAQVIEQHSHNKYIRFAHSISNDFDNQRHMTAGVAVVVKEKFEKPTAIQIIEKRSCSSDQQQWYLGLKPDNQRQVFWETYKTRLKRSI